MSSARNTKANRENAEASTGPKTVTGQARSSLNALRHPLSIALHSAPTWSEQIEGLAAEIAGPNANAEVRGLARRVAEAQFDVVRARCARQTLLSNNLSEPYYDTHANTRQKVALIKSLLRNKAPDISVEVLANYLSATPKGPQKLATILLQEAKEIHAIDRYERRALSRRKFAIRDLDAAKLKVE